MSRAMRLFKAGPAEGIPLKLKRVDNPPARAGPGASAGPGLRGLPHRSTHRRRGNPPPGAAGHPWPPGCGRDRSPGRRGERPGRSVTGLGCPGCTRPAASVNFAGAAKRTSAPRRVSPDFTWTAVLPITCWPRPRTCCPCRPQSRTIRLRRCSAPASSGTGPCGRPILSPGERLGLVGFGASAHLAIQVARFWGCEVYVFTRSAEHRRHAETLGAAWVGGVEEEPPRPLDRAVIFAPAGRLVPLILAKLRPGWDPGHQRHPYVPNP